MSSSADKENHAAESNHSPSEVERTGEQAASPSGEDNPSGESSVQEKKPVFAHLEQNFGVLSRVLIREVFRRGLIDKSVDEMYTTFYMRSTQIIELLRSEFDAFVLRTQLLEMLYLLLEPMYGAEHTRMLVPFMETFDDLSLFQGILSTDTLHLLVDRAQEYYDHRTTRGSGMVGVSNNYSGVNNENARGTQAGHNNSSGASRNTYTDFYRDRYVDPQPEPKVTRGGLYTEGSTTPAPSHSEEGSMPAASAGWSAGQRKPLEPERDVRMLQHHHHIRVQDQRVTFPHHQHHRHQVHGVARHQVVVGSGPMGLQQQQQQHQQQQQQQQQQQHQQQQQQESVSMPGEHYMRAPINQTSKRGLLSEPVDDAPPHRGPLWRGAPLHHHHHVHLHHQQQQQQQQQQQHQQQQQQQLMNEHQPPQTLYHQRPQQAASSTPSPNHNQHQTASPPSPPHPKLLVQHRHAIPPFMPPTSVRKQPVTIPSPQLQPQTHSQVQSQPQIHVQPPAATTERGIFIHHHHHHHHQHNIPPQLPIATRVSPSSSPSPPPPNNYRGAKQMQEPIAQTESKSVPKVEVATPQIKPHFHHQVLVHHHHALRQGPQMSAPESLGGDTPSPAPMIPTHRHNIQSCPQHHHNIHHHHHLHHLHPHHHHHHHLSALPTPPPQQQRLNNAPISIDAALSDDGAHWSSPHKTPVRYTLQETRSILRSGGINENTINMLVKMLDELIMLPPDILEDRIKKEGLTNYQRDLVWNVLHPNDKSLLEKSGIESELRNFVHNNSINNNMAGDGKDDGPSSKRPRQGKAMLHVPQPRTSQSKQQQDDSAREYRAVVWLSGVAPSQLQSVVDEVSKYGKVVDHGKAAQRPDWVFCKLGGRNDDLHTVRKIGVAVVEDYYCVSPRDVGDGTPPMSGTRMVDPEDMDNSKPRIRATGNMHPFAQQVPHHRIAYTGDKEGETNGDDGRGHRKVLQHRGSNRGRGGFHGSHRHNENGQICKFYSKGICRYGDDCQYSHQTKNSSR